MSDKTMVDATAGTPEDMSNIVDELGDLENLSKVFGDLSVETEPEDSIDVETSSLTKFLKGAGNVPAGFEAASTALNHRLDIAMAFVVVKQVSRIFKINKALEQLEGEVLEGTAISNMPEEEKTKLLANSQKTMMGMLEFVRKFQVQRGQVAASRDPQTERILLALKNVPAERKDALLSLINNALGAQAPSTASEEM